MRIEFICIIWTSVTPEGRVDSSWGLNLFVLFEPTQKRIRVIVSSWGLNLFVLFELVTLQMRLCTVLEDWIYLYYLNYKYLKATNHAFLRIEFICIIWTLDTLHNGDVCSWGLNLFVLFELWWKSIWLRWVLEDWIYLYYLNWWFMGRRFSDVLEDWIYLYYLNSTKGGNYDIRFLRIEFICIIWTGRSSAPALTRSWGLNLFVLFEQKQKKYGRAIVLEDWIYLYYLNDHCVMFMVSMFLRIEFICIIWTLSIVKWIRESSWGLNLFVLFEHNMN